jgi:predicted ATPase
MLLDNCEHVLGAAADLAERSWPGPERSRSRPPRREGLRVAAEHAWLVPSLGVDAPGSEEPAAVHRTSDRRER